MAKTNWVELQHPNKNIPNVGASELIDAIRYSVYDKEDRLLIWGAPGIGKTQIVGQVSAETNGALIDLQLANMSPEDFFLPSIDKEAKRSTRILLDEMSCFYHKDNAEGDAIANGPGGHGGILFLDELSRATPPVQNICLKLINERKIGDYRLGSQWTIVAASNREMDDNSPYMFSTALANRFTTQVNFVPSVDEWVKWAISYKENGKGAIDQTVIGYLQFDKEYFHRLDPTDGAELWPSPRTWAAAGRKITMMQQKNGRQLTESEAKRSIESTIGGTSSLKYLSYLNVVNSIDVRELSKVYTDPDKAPIPTIDKVTGQFPQEVASAIFRSIPYLKRDVVPTRKDFKNIVKYCIRLDNPTWGHVIMSIYTAVIDQYLTESAQLSADYADEIMVFLNAYPKIMDAKYKAAYEKHVQIRKIS